MLRRTLIIDDAAAAGVKESAALLLQFPVDVEKIKAKTRTGTGGGSAADRMYAEYLETLRGVSEAYPLPVSCEEAHPLPAPGEEAHSIPAPGEEMYPFPVPGEAELAAAYTGFLAVEALRIEVFILSPVSLAFGGLKDGPEAAGCDGCIRIAQHFALPVHIAPARTFAGTHTEIPSPACLAFYAVLAHTFPSASSGAIGHITHSADIIQPGRRMKALLMSDEETDQTVEETLAAKEAQTLKETPARDWVWVLETNIDDTTGEAIGYAIGLLMAAGALDASAIGLMMKKNRPGFLFQVICRQEQLAEMEDILFRETHTIGLRRYREYRDILPRQIRRIQTRFGEVRVKCVTHHGSEFLYPEYEDVKLIAARQHLSFTEVYGQVTRDIVR